MKKLTFLFILIPFHYNCNSQNIEVNLLLRKELVRQRDNLIKQVRDIQTKIDSLDKNLSHKPQIKNHTLFLTKPVNYSNNNYSKSIESSQSKQYKTRTTRVYYRGPRGGCYYINSNGNKTYVSRSLCN